jgi:hypothetical protein
MTSYHTWPRRPRRSDPTPSCRPRAGTGRHGAPGSDRCANPPDPPGHRRAQHVGAQRREHRHARRLPGRPLRRSVRRRARCRLPAARAGLARPAVPLPGHPARVGHPGGTSPARRRTDDTLTAGRCPAAALAVEPRSDIPVHLAALGPTAVRLASELADGWYPFLLPRSALNSWSEAGPRCPSSCCRPAARCPSWSTRWRRCVPSDARSERFGPPPFCAVLCPFGHLVLPGDEPQRPTGAAANTGKVAPWSGTRSKRVGGETKRQPAQAPVRSGSRQKGAKPDTARWRRPDPCWVSGGSGQPSAVRATEPSPTC